MVKKYFILLNHIHHLQKQLTLHIIKHIKVFSDNFRQFVVSFAAERKARFQPWNSGILLLFLFLFVLGSVFHEDEVSSLNKFEGVFAQGHSFMKAILIAVTRKYLKRRIMYSYGHAGSFNPAVITNKEAQMIYGNMNNETRSSQAADKKTSRNFLPHQPVVLVKTGMSQTEALTPYFKRKENRHILVDAIKNLHQ